MAEYDKPKALAIASQVSSGSQSSEIEESMRIGMPVTPPIGFSTLVVLSPLMV